MHIALNSYIMIVFYSKFVLIMMFTKENFSSHVNKKELYKKYYLHLPSRLK